MRVLVYNGLTNESQILSPDEASEYFKSLPPTSLPYIEVVILWDDLDE
jgi:hypothetical protein